VREFVVTVRIDTPQEILYYLHGVGERLRSRASEK